MRRSTSHRSPRACASFGLASLLCLVALDAVAQTVSGPLVLQSEGAPDAVLVGDFDDDQIPDVIATAPATLRVNVHGGRGNGLFRFPLAISIGSGLADLALGDLDGNGADDLVGVDRISGDLVILHQFPGTAVPYRLTRLPGEDEPAALLLRDLENDGDLDVLVAFGGADEIGIYRNAGTHLAPLEHRWVGDGPATLSVLDGASPAYAVAQRGVLSRNVAIFDTDWNTRQLLLVHPVSDIQPTHWNADGNVDFLLIDQDGQAQVYLGSSGDWNAGPSWPISAGATRILGFAAKDGRAGAAVLEAANNRISVHIEGTNSPAPDPGWYLGGGASRMASADIDGDLEPEILVPLPEDNLVLILRRNGDALRGYRSYRVGNLPARIRSHEPVGGLPARLFTLCAGSDSVWPADLVDGELLPRPQLAVQLDARELRLGPIDGDGLPDAAVLSLTTGVRIFRSDGNGFAPPIEVPMTGDLRDLALLHADDDGHLDLAVADVLAHGVRLFHGDGLGGFTPGDTLVSVDPSIVLRVADFDLDGRDDLLAIGNDRRPSLFYRNADGSHQRFTWLLGEELRGVAIGNFNGDPYPDIAIGNAGDQTYSVLSSILPRLLVLSEEDRAAPDGSEVMTALDVDGDGLDDLVMSSSTARGVSIHLATGTGRFAPPSRLRCSTLPLDLHSFDANGDGTKDILVTDGFGASLVALEVFDHGAGSAQEPVAAPVAAGTRLSGLSVFPNPSRDPIEMRVHSRGLAPSFEVYDLRGRLVRRLATRAQGGGWYAAAWSGDEVAAGRYYLRVRAGEEQRIRPLTRLPR